MPDKQLPIPGLEAERKKPASLDEQIAELARRVLRLELEVSLLRILVENPKGELTMREKERQKLPASCESYGITRDFGPDCYFWSDDRCLGRPADACPWSVKVGDWEWLCVYPWKKGASNESHT